MNSPILYAFILHVIVSGQCCDFITASEDRGRPISNADNQTEKSQPSQSETCQNNTIANLKKTDKKCLLTANESDLFSLWRLARSNVVHIVELDLKFARYMNNFMINEWRWMWTNNVGLEISSVLAMKNMDVTCTLEVGRKTAQVSVADNPPGCTKFEKNSEEFIAKSILKQLSFADKKEICFNKINNSTHTKCCTIFAKDPLKYHCYVSIAGSKFVKVLKTMLSVYNVIVFPFVLVFLYFAIFLQWRNADNNNDIHQYYKLTESPLSISSILSMLFWDGYGKYKSFARRCLFLVVLFGFFWLTDHFHSILFTAIFSFFGLFYPFSKLYQILDQNEEPSDQTEETQSLVQNEEYPDQIDDNKPQVQNDQTKSHFVVSPYLLKFFSLLHYDIEDVYMSATKSSVSEASINLITLPFNIKQWKKSLIECIDDSTCTQCSPLVYVKNCILGLFYIIFVFILQVLFFLVITLESYASVLIMIVKIRKKKIKRKCMLALILSCEYLCLFCIVYSLVTFLRYIPYLAISLLSGIILNVVYFFPYIVYVSIFTFYSWVIWTSVELQYVILMRLIFENNREKNDNDKKDKQENDNNNVDDGHAKIVCVVSKELYDNIRECRLPYHKNVFRFVLKIFWIGIFAYLSLTLVQALQASNVSPTVQVLTTFSIVVFPYVMNIVAAEKDEEQKDAWKQQLKHCVKPLVDAFTVGRENELRKTEMSLPHQMSVFARIMKTILQKKEENDARKKLSEDSLEMIKHESSV